MGCSSGREANPLEVKLCEAQARLGFGNCKATDVLSAFQTWSVGRFVLHKHWLAIAHKLSLSVSSPEAVRFFSLFHTSPPPNLSEHVASISPGLGSGFVDESEPVYDKKSLITLGVLLAQGNNYDKGKAIFEAFDEKCDGEFHDRDLRVILGELFRIAIEVLPTLLLPDEQTAEINQYLTVAKSQIDTAIGLAVTLILDKRRSVNSDQFADKVEEYQASELCNPSGLRKRAHAAHRRGEA